MADGWCASLSPGNSPLSLAAVCRVHVHLPDMPSRMKREHPVASAPLPQPHKSSQTTVVDEQVIVLRLRQRPLPNSLPYPVCMCTTPGSAMSSANVRGTSPP